jgi:hypothetical protein
VQAAVKNVEDWLAKEENKKRWKLPRKAETPLVATCMPELDVNSQEAAYYQSLIGILRWIVERRADICIFIQTRA